ncbi:hypothetical protein HDU81_003393 [Chytriomyces hyalinus]|nr:hypothetical protein HDU81_003393 [Chytriomyces hyalinus]
MLSFFGFGKAGNATTSTTTTTTTTKTSLAKPDAAKPHTSHVAKQDEIVTVQASVQATPVVRTIDDVDQWHSAMKRLRIDQLEQAKKESLRLREKDTMEKLAKVDQFAISTPKSHVNSVKQLAEHLTTPYNDAVCKTRAIFAWVANNVSYDVQGYLSGKRRDQSAEAVLQDRICVCEGYANLFLALCEAAPKHSGHEDIIAVKITGAAMGAGVEAGDVYANLDAHAWNAVQIHGEFRFIESTWAAGVMANGKFDKQYNPGPYFLVKPTEFIFSHIPKSDPSLQHLAIPLSHKEWIQLPQCGPAFRINGMRLVRARGLQKTTTALLSYLEINDDLVEIVVEVDEERHAATGGVVLGHITHGKCAPIHVPAGREVVWVDRPLYKDTVRDAGGLAQSMMVHTRKSETPGKMLWILRAHVGKGDFVAKVPGKNAYYPALSFRVKNTGAGKHAPPPTLFAGSVKVVEPLSGTLRVGETVRFKVQGPQDAIVMSPSKQITKFQKVVGNDGFQIADVVIDAKGDWQVGHGTVQGNATRYEFGAKFQAA